MKKIIFVFMTSILPLLLKAQVTLSVQLPPAGMIHKDQLWNLVLVNNSSENLEAIVSVSLQDAVTGQTVLSAGSKSFTLVKGVKLLNALEVQPVQYNYLAVELSSNFIPLGSYIVCYRVVKSLGEGTAPVADECVRLNISPLSPPQLSLPADKSTVQSGYPQFSWLPPTPMEMFNNLTYDIAVVEVLQGQSSADAIMNNLPSYTNGNIKSPLERYPSSFSALQPGKLYGWQITARNGSNYVAQSEVWTFSLPVDSTSIITENVNFIELKNGNGNSGVNSIKGKNLYIKYYSFYKDHQTSVRILSPDGKVMQEIKQKIIYGDNFLWFSLNRSFELDKVYTLEITDPNQILNSMKFSIKE